MKLQTLKIILTGLIICTVLFLVVAFSGRLLKANIPQFDGERAYQAVVSQVEMGPRTLGSPAHAQVRQWITQELAAAGWQTEIQTCTDCAPQPIYNIVAWRQTDDLDAPWLIVGAHYDSRFYADQDPDPNQHRVAVPGANDGASGVALLLELARVLPESAPKRVWLVFFDAEDNGSLPGYDWIMGSQAFVRALQAGATLPDAAVIVDMIGDADLNLYRERNSDPDLVTSIWQQAEELGYSQFINTPRHRILDDHIPFLEAGIPAVDIIDFDYPYWHTVADTPDKVSAESLRAVGQTLLVWIIQQSIK